MTDKTEHKSAKRRAEIEAEYRERIETIDKHGRLFDRVIDALPDDLTSAYLYNGYGGFYASGDQHTLSACIRALRIHGFKSDAKPEPKKPTFEARYTHDSGFYLYLNFSSKVCRRVQIGTQMVEQPIYETVCGEMSLPA